MSRRDCFDREFSTRSKKSLTVSLVSAAGAAGLLAVPPVAGKEPVPFFEDPVFYVVGHQAPWGLAAGDVNVDGYPDLAVTDGEGGITIFLNTKDWESRATGLELSQRLVVPGAPVLGEVEFADINHDCSEDQTDTYWLHPDHGVCVEGSATGHLNGGTRVDLAFAVGSSDECQLDKIGVLLGKGDGKFQIHPSGHAYLYSADNDPDIWRGPIGLRIVDLDMDGYGDLVTANHAHNDISVLINRLVVAVPDP